MLIGRFFGPFRYRLLLSLKHAIHLPSTPASEREIAGSKGLRGPIQRRFHSQGPVAPVRPHGLAGPDGSQEKARAPQTLDERGEDAGRVDSTWLDCRASGLNTATPSGPSSERPLDQFGTLLKSRISGVSPGRSHFVRSTTNTYRESSTMNSGSVAFQRPLTGFWRNDLILM